MQQSITVNYNTKNKLPTNLRKKRQNAYREEGFREHEGFRTLSEGLRDAAKWFPRTAGEPFRGAGHMRWNLSKREPINKQRYVYLRMIRKQRTIWKH